MVDAPRRWVGHERPFCNDIACIRVTDPMDRAWNQFFKPWAETYLIREERNWRYLQANPHESSAWAEAGDHDIMSPLQVIVNNTHGGFPR